MSPETISSLLVALVVGGPAITAIEGGDVEAAAQAANAQFQDLLDSEQ